MKSITIFSIGLLLLSSCIHVLKQETQNNPIVGDTMTDSNQTNYYTVNSCDLSNSGIIWKIEVNKKDYKEYLVRGDSLSYIEPDALVLIKELNKYFRVDAEFIKMNKRDIYIRILNVDYFTQQMGDTGADWFMASTVFTLTEIPNIDYVVFEFNQGDHGGIPGRKSRNDYLSSYPICE